MRDRPALERRDGLNPVGLEGIEAIVVRTVGERPSLLESVLPHELRRLPAELERGCAVG